MRRTQMAASSLRFFQGRKALLPEAGTKLLQFICPGPAVLMQVRHSKSCFKKV